MLVLVPPVSKSTPCGAPIPAPDWAEAGAGEDALQVKVKSRGEGANGKRRFSRAISSVTSGPQQSHRAPSYRHALRCSAVQQSGRERVPGRPPPRCVAGGQFCVSPVQFYGGPRGAWIRPPSLYSSRDSLGLSPAAFTLATDQRGSGRRSPPDPDVLRLSVVLGHKRLADDSTALRAKHTRPGAPGALPSLGPKMADTQCAGSRAEREGMGWQLPARWCRAPSILTGLLICWGPFLHLRHPGGALQDIYSGSGMERSH
ncbi:hypothetical protein NDU88_006424 [Pleurodeles waltl]|uniref:Uncharacterized protein n=1 Tax=Pleurodeles waltl TaxID=8319 RepID=A0AAV7MC69_PLEWA|nr:hypothetical protein NDU88_006424 [Pleurodeles waltl]